MKLNILYSMLLCSLPVLGNTHLVSNTDDQGVGSLRQAIINANEDPNPPRYITFNIESGVQIIKPKTSLPPLTNSHIIIDGTTQDGWSAGNPVIVLDGSLTSTYTAQGLVIKSTHDCVIDSLVISNGFQKGIAITGNSNDNAIYGCFVGVDQTGTSTQANAIGIDVHTLDNNQNNNTVIGAPARGNVISGNKYAAIFLSGNVKNTVIQSNKMGTDKNGMFALANQLATLAILSLPVHYDVLCSNLKIGGSQLNEGNIISGNSGPAILMGAQPISNVIIQGNIIGADATGIIPLLNGATIVALQTGGLSVNDLIIEDNIIMP